MLFGLQQLIKSKKNKNKLILAAILIGLAALTRPQILPLGFIIAFSLLFINYNNTITKIRHASIFILTFLLTYSLWPMRNYFIHDELIFTKNADGFANWQKDVVSFMQYTYSLKAEWDPQYTSIIKNQKTVYPKIAYTNKADSLKLERAIYLAKNCGSGFSFKKDIGKAHFSNQIVMTQLPIFLMNLN